MSEIKDENLERLRKVCDELSEHFDSVQVFVTRHESNDVGTVAVNMGRGNWFARYGQVREWSNKEEGLHARTYSVDE